MVSPYSARPLTHQRPFNISGRDKIPSPMTRTISTGDVQGWTWDLPSAKHLHPLSYLYSTPKKICLYLEGEPSSYPPVFPLQQPRGCGVLPTKHFAWVNNGAQGDSATLQLFNICPCQRQGGSRWGTQPSLLIGQILPFPGLCICTLWVQEGTKRHCDLIVRQAPFLMCSGKNWK